MAVSVEGKQGFLSFLLPCPHCSRLPRRAEPTGKWAAAFEVLDVGSLRPAPVPAGSSAREQSWGARPQETSHQRSHPVQTSQRRHTPFGHPTQVFCPGKVTIQPSAPPARQEGRSRHGHGLVSCQSPGGSQAHRRGGWGEGEGRLST